MSHEKVFFHPSETERDRRRQSLEREIESHKSAAELADAVANSNENLAREIEQKNHRSNSFSTINYYKSLAASYRKEAVLHRRRMRAAQSKLRKMK